jgi:hypothetical protein
LLWFHRAESLGQSQERLEGHLVGNWTGKIEYLRMDFGSVATYPVPNGPTVATDAFQSGGIFISLRPKGAGRWRHASATVG